MTLNKIRFFSHNKCEKEMILMNNQENKINQNENLKDNNKQNKKQDKKNERNEKKFN